MTFESQTFIVRIVAKGEKIVDIVQELKQLTYSSGNEHALVKLVSGERVIFADHSTGMRWAAGEITRLIIHSHPYHTPPPGPSNFDFAALEFLGQPSSWLLEHGSLTKFWRK